jgi:hypothetical protein
MTIITEKLVSSVTDVLAMLDEQNAGALFGDDFTHVSKSIKKTAWKSKKLHQSSDRKPAISVYGPSQAGKSFLASVLVRPSNKPLEISFPGTVGKKEYISEINPSGDRECTGLVTRFTLNSGHKNSEFPVLLKLLSEIDLVCILINSYFHDGDQRHEVHKTAAEIASHISKYTSPNSETCTNLSDADFWELEEYLQENFSTFEYAKTLTPFVETIAKNALTTLDINLRANLYAPFWGFHEEFTKLFLLMMEVLHEFKFSTEIHAGINTLVPKSASIIDVLALNNIFSGSDDTIEVQTPAGAIIKVGRGLLSAVTAELVLDVSDVPHDFMKHTDVLDFPGTRNRQPENLNEHFAGFVENDNDIHHYLLRGKVAYLFEKYVNSQDINAMLLCVKHSNMESVGLPPLIDKWVKNSIGATADTRGQQPNSLFFVMTFFDQHLLDTAANRHEPDRFSRRIGASLLEIFGRLPDSWPKNWDGNSNHPAPFRNCYFLRNPGVDQQYFKREENGEEVFDVDNNGKVRISELKKMYLETTEIQKHFIDPETSWSEVMRENDGGTSYILENLAKICKPDIKTVQLDNLAATLFQELKSTLSQYFVPTEFGERQRLNQRKIDLLTKEVNEMTEAQIFAEFLEEFYISSDYFQAKPESRKTTQTSDAMKNVCDVWFDKAITTSKNISQRYPISKASVEFFLSEMKLSIVTEHVSDAVLKNTRFLDFGGADSYKKALAFEISAFIINDFVSLNGKVAADDTAILNLSNIRENMQEKFASNWLMNFSQKVEANITNADGLISDQVLNEKLGELIRGLNP